MNRKMAYLRILCGILPFVFFFSLFAFYLLVEDMGWLARLLCILCVLGTLGVCLAFQVWFYRIVQSRRREEQRLALAQECVRQQSLLLHHAESGQNGNDPSAASLLSTIFQAYARRLTAAGGGIASTCGWRRLHPLFLRASISARFLTACWPMPARPCRRCRIVWAGSG
ncbi:MAG: hypothetical protein PUI26_02965 [Selenomonadaceae bacterium]|nr:hypothetical protein [Selenomonadaceae bacterium]MDD7055767.1 hypothetical protein [Selenomonadaceae bacterium]